MYTCLKILIINKPYKNHLMKCPRCSIPARVGEKGEEDGEEEDNAHESCPERLPELGVDVKAGERLSHTKTFTVPHIRPKVPGTEEVYHPVYHGCCVSATQMEKWGSVVV